MMKVGFVKKKFDPFGGGERYLASIIEGLREEGLDIHVFSSDWKDTGGLTVHKVKTLRFTSPASVWSFNRNLARALAGMRLDCLVSFERVTFGDVYRAGDGCHREWLDIRRRVEGSLKSLSFAVNPLHRLLLSMEEEIFRRTRTIIANSRMVRDDILRHYEVPEGKIRVIYNGVDTRRFTNENRAGRRRALRRELGLPEDAPLVLFAGSGYERKGLGTLLKALPDMADPARVLVAGRGDIKGFSRLAAFLGVSERTIFLGPRRDIADLYAASDLFVLPTLYDPFSNATLEALASGLPVITTRKNGAAELVEDGEEGYVLSDMLASAELADKANAILENIGYMSERARRKAEQYPISGAADEFMEVIRKCLG
ncbi:MAG: glycosyltransferase family 4 protein [Thermodesulfovibrionales bacterium]